MPRKANSPADAGRKARAVPRGGRQIRQALAALVLGLLASFLSNFDEAAAHDARPLAINITERPGGLFLVRVQVPPSVEAVNWPKILWPDACSVGQSRLQDDLTVPTETMVLSCPRGLEGSRLTVKYGVYNPSLATLFRVRKLGGEEITHVLPPDGLEWQVPKAPSWTSVARQYLALGALHIWNGIDHLLFVTGLLILARTPRRIFLAITGFTIAHSITLSLSVLGLVQLPIPPVEAAIALSIIFLAREIARPLPDGFAARFPIVVSSSFGLLHGFGFAAALGEVGLPKGDLAMGLLCFNLGVEAGQLAFVAAIGALFLLVRSVPGFAGGPLRLPQDRAARLAGYGLGIPAAFWFVERLAAF